MVILEYIVRVLCFLNWCRIAFGIRSADIFLVMQAVGQAGHSLSLCDKYDIYMFLYYNNLESQATIKMC